MFCLNDSTDFIYEKYSWHRYCKFIFDEKKVLEDSKNTGDKVKSLATKLLLY